MVIGRKARLHHINYDDIFLYINGQRVEHVTEFKYLGVDLSNDLCFKVYAKSIMNKMASKIFLLIRIGKHFSEYVRLLLYKSIVAPALDYVTPVLYNAQLNQLDRLQKIQNKALRFITKSSKYARISDMLKRTGLLNVKMRIKYISLICVYRLKNRLLPEQLCSEFSVQANLHEHATRQRNHLTIRQANLHQVNSSVFYKGFQDFNQLPPDIRDSASLGKFKSLLFEHLHST